MIAGDINPWLALALFTFSFVCTLGVAIVILTLAGRELGIRQLLPEDEREIDDRDTSMTRLLVITLLPFLAIYAAFGQVSEAAYRFVTQQWIRYGFLSDQKTVLGALHDLATQHLPWLVAHSRWHLCAPPGARLPWPSTPAYAYSVSSWS